MSLRRLRLAEPIATSTKTERSRRREYALATGSITPTSLQRERSQADELRKLQYYSRFNVNQRWLTTLPRKPTRIVLMTTAPEALSYFLSPHIRLLSAQGCEVHTITSPGLDQLGGKSNLESIHHDLIMRRKISPVKDIVSLYFLWRLLRRIRPEILQTHTPKAGLLGMIAAWMTHVPIRIYTINGLPIRVERLLSSLVLGITERLACALSTEVLCVSRSVRRFVIGKRFCSSRKCQVLGDGGSHGVDLIRFDSQVHGASDRHVIRNRYGIPRDALLIGYIGRVVPAKGINELALAWNMLRDKFPHLRMLMCGYCERDHPMQAILLEKLRSDSRVYFTRDRVTDMPAMYAALDIVVLPTYCEGLPNVVLEAGAMRLPVVATRVPGCVDAIRNRVTGLLVKPRDPEALAQAVQFLVENPEYRERMGNAAREFISRRFSETRISSLLLEKYSDLRNWIESAGSEITCRAGRPVSGKHVSAND